MSLPFLNVSYLDALVLLLMPDTASADMRNAYCMRAVVLRANVCCDVWRVRQPPSTSTAVLAVLGRTLSVQKKMPLRMVTTGRMALVQVVLTTFLTRNGKRRNACCLLSRGTCTTSGWRNWQKCARRSRQTKPSQQLKQLKSVSNS